MDVTSGDPGLASHLFIILTLILASGVLAMAKVALVSAKPLRLKVDEGKGSRSAQRVLRLLGEPQVVLPTVRVTITILGIVLGAYVASSLSPAISHLLPSTVSSLSTAGVTGLVIALTAYLLVVWGEIVPRRIASAYPEEVARCTSALVSLLARLLYPLVFIADLSGSLVMRFVPLKESTREQLTEDEIRVILEKGAEAGVLDPTESRILTKAFRFGDKPAAALMTPRNDVVWLDSNDSPGQLWEEVRESGHSYFPVCDGAIDTIVGIASVRDVAQCLLDGSPLLRRELLKDALQLPSTTTAITILERFKREKRRVALVIDEYGGVDGLVTTHDLMEALVGEIHDDEAGDEARIIQREDGSYLVDASIDLDELVDQLALPPVAHRERQGYHSLGGLVMEQLGHVPREGDTFLLNGYKFEVVDMDGYRIDKVLVSEAAPS